MILFLLDIHQYSSLFTIKKVTHGAMRPDEEYWCLAYIRACFACICMYASPYISACCVSVCVCVCVRMCEFIGVNMGFAYGDRKTMVQKRLYTALDYADLKFEKLHIERHCTGFFFDLNSAGFINMLI